MKFSCMLAMPANMLLESGLSLFTRWHQSWVKPDVRVSHLFTPLQDVTLQTQFLASQKKSACTILQNMPQSVCSKLYKSPAESWLAAATEFVLLMYGKKAGKCKTLNELRYKLATTTDKPANQLPPTDDAFKQHALRAMYQSLIWCNSHLPKPHLGEPEDFGWYRDSSGLHPILFTQDSAPAEVRDLTHLYCQCKESNCKDGTKCTCVHAGLKCNELCSCEDCPNIQSRAVSSAED